MQDARLAGRLQKELKMLQDPPPGVCVWPSDDHNLARLEAQIQGPDGTVYAKGIFKLEVEIPDRYPFQPPNVKFITPVYHPNIDSGGRICHDILNMPPKGQWRPSLNIGAVLASIRVLLEEPNHDDGLMSDISAEYKHNRAVFDAKARQSTERHAMQSSAQKETGSCPDNQKLETSKQDALARPVLKEVNRVGASKVTLDEPSTSGCGNIAPSPVLAKPRHTLAAKLSLGKGCAATPDRGGTSSNAAVRGPGHKSSLSFSSENQRASQMEVCLGQSSQGASQPGGNEVHVPCIGKELANKLFDAIRTEVTVGVSGGESVGAEVRRDAASCSVEKDILPQPQMFASQSGQRTAMSAGSEAHVFCMGKESTDKLVDATRKKATAEISSREIINAGVAGDIARRDAASCGIEKDKPPQSQMFTSQSGQRTSMPDHTGNRPTAPKLKSLKLCRPPTSATQTTQQTPRTGRVPQESNHAIKAGTGSAKGPVIILDSESDEDDCVMPSSVQAGVKRKLSRV